MLTAASVKFLSPSTDNALNNTLSKGNLGHILCRNLDTLCSYSEKEISSVKNLHTSSYHCGKYISIFKIPIAMWPDTCPIRYCDFPDGRIDVQGPES